MKIPLSKGTTRGTFVGFLVIFPLQLFSPFSNSTCCLFFAIAGIMFQDITTLSKFTHFFSLSTFLFSASIFRYGQRICEWLCSSKRRHCHNHRSPQSSQCHKPRFFHVLLRFHNYACY